MKAGERLPQPRDPQDPAVAASSLGWIQVSPSMPGFWPPELGGKKSLC